MTLRAVAQPAVNAATAPTVGQGFQNSLRTVSADTSLATSDYTVLTQSASPVTVTLPALPAAAGRVYNIKKIDTTASVVTITTPDGRNIDGTPTRTLTTQNQSITVQGSVANWWII